MKEGADAFHRVTVSFKAAAQLVVVTTWTVPAGEKIIEKIDIPIPFGTFYAAGFRLLEGEGQFNESGVVEFVFFGLDSERKVFSFAFTPCRNDYTVIEAVFKVAHLRDVIMATYRAARANYTFGDANKQALLMAHYFDQKKFVYNDSNGSANVSTTAPSLGKNWMRLTSDDAFFQINDSETGIVKKCREHLLQLESTLPETDDDSVPAQVSTIINKICADWIVNAIVSGAESAAFGLAKGTKVVLQLGAKDHYECRVVIEHEASSTRMQVHPLRMQNIISSVNVDKIFLPIVNQNEVEVNDEVMAKRGESVRFVKATVRAKNEAANTVSLCWEDTGEEGCISLPCDFIIVVKGGRNNLLISLKQESMRLPLREQCSRQRI
jgi:hypothetical protein